MSANRSNKRVIFLIGVIVILLTGFSVWKRYHSTELRIGKVQALAEAGRFDEANSEIDRLQQLPEGEHSEKINDLRAKVLLEQARQWEEWNDDDRSRNAYHEVVKIAPKSEYAQQAAEEIWMTMRNIDPEEALRLFEIARKPKLADTQWLGDRLRNYYYKKPVYRMMDMVPGKWGFSGSWDWGDPYTALDMIDEALSDGSLDEMEDRYIHDVKAWRFLLLLYTGSFPEALAQLRELMPEKDVPDDIIFFAGNYDDFLNNPQRSDIGDIEFVRQLQAQPGEESGTIILRADFEGRPFPGLVCLLQQVDGTNVTYGSSSFSGVFELNSYMNWPKQIVFQGVTDEDGVVRAVNIPPGDYRWRFYMNNKNLDPDWAFYHTAFEKDNEIQLKAGETYENPFSVKRQYRIDIIEPVGMHVLGDEPVTLKFEVRAPKGEDFPPPEELAFEVSLTDQSIPNYTSGLGGNLKLEKGVFEAEITTDLEGFDDLRKMLQNRRERSGPFCLLEPNIRLQDQDFSSNMSFASRPELLLWLETPPAEYQSNPLIDHWAFTIRERFDPDQDDEKGIRGGIPELLSRSPKTPMRCWLNLYLAMSYWNSRDMERVQSMLEELITDPLAQGPISKAAERALADVTHGKALPNNWRFNIYDNY
jgi:hypothetical protein